MIDQDKIKSIVAICADTFKKRRGLIKPSDWGENYVFATTVQKGIEAHAKLCAFPADLMKAKAPNETQQEIQYRKDNFEPITKSYWDRGLSEIMRIWAEQNYSIDFTDESIKDYFTKKYPTYGSMLTFFKTVATPYKINDPNAMLVIEIGDMPMVQDSETQEWSYDESTELSPVAKIYGADRILMHDIDEYVLMLSDEKSFVSGKGDKPVREGIVLFLYDDTNIYTITQYGKQTDYFFKPELLYTHNLGYIPCKRLGGKTNTDSKGDDITYESYFQSAVPHLNKALKLDSTLDISIAKHAYPIRTYFENKCSNPDCKDGKVAVYDPANVDAMTDQPTAAQVKDCGTCGGSGYTIRFSPMKDYTMKPVEGFNNEQAMPFPGIAYVSPDPTILDFNKNSIEGYLTQAFAFLNIDISIKPSGDKNGGQKEVTATKSKIDREALHAFLLKLSEEVFAHLQFTCDTIYKLRFLKEESPIVVVPPLQFDIRDVAELTEELNTAYESNLPTVVTRQLTKDLLALRFPAQKGLQRFTDILFYCDPFADYQTQDIALLKGQQAISNQDIIMHYHLQYWLDQAIADDPKYLDKELKDIKADMLALVETKVGELQTQAANDPNSASNIMKQRMNNVG